MSNLITPPQTYYENEENHGNYQYHSFEFLVTKFMNDYTGDDSLLGNIHRTKVISAMKAGIREFNFNALQEIKVVELELNDVNKIILPPNFVDWVRISWLNEKTGKLHPMSQNNNKKIPTSYLQDHEANILFDQDGFILEGTSATEKLHDEILHTYEFDMDCGGCGGSGNGQANYRINTSVNGNGDFIVDRRSGFIKFSTNVSSKIIVLEYLSDGLDYLNPDQISVNKKATQALLEFTNKELLKNSIRVPMYEKNASEKRYWNEYRKAKVSIANFRVAEVTQMLKYRNTFIR